MKVILRLRHEVFNMGFSFRFLLSGMIFSMPLITLYIDLILGIKIGDSFPG